MKKQLLRFLLTAFLALTYITGHSAVLLPETKATFTTSTGTPLAGGKIYTYIAGTTTPKVTYTDSTQVTANANPVILDSRGQANIWLKSNEAYKIVVQNSAGVVQWTTDNVSNSNLADSNSSPINLIAEGAIPNDNIDDCLPIQTAINKAVSTRKTLYAPAGEYKLDCSISIAGRLTMVGDGMNNTIFNYTPVNGVAFTWTADGSYSSLKGLKFYNNNNSRVLGQTSTGFQTYQGSAAVLYLFDEVWIQGFSLWGIDWNDSFNGKFVNGRLQQNGVRGTLANGGTDGQGGGVQFQRITFTGAATTGNDFTNIYVTGNNVGIQMKKGGSNNKAFNTRFDNVILEENYIGIDLRNTGTGGMGRYQFLNTCYGEANLYAMAWLDEGSVISSYQNNTTPGTGTPPSVSTDGADGILFVGRYVEDRPSRFRIGNNSASPYDGSQSIGFALDKNELTNYITKARFFNNNAITLVPDTTSSPNTYTTISSGAGSPEGSVTANNGSIYTKNNGTELNNTLYIKASGDNTNTGWQALNALTSGSTANRPSSPSAGTVYANTTYGNTEQYDGARWRNTATGVANPVNMSNGGTTNVVEKTLVTYNTNASLIATHTINIPVCTSGDRFIIGGGGGITALTLASAGGFAFQGATTTLPANTSIEYICNDTSSTLYKLR